MISNRDRFIEKRMSAVEALEIAFALLEEARQEEIRIDDGPAYRKGSKHFSQARYNRLLTTVDPNRIISGHARHRTTALKIKDEQARRRYTKHMQEWRAAHIDPFIVKKA